MDETRIERRCPRCGQLLPADAPEGLCPACLFGAGAETLTESDLAGDAATVLSADLSAAPHADEPRLHEGQAFGPYRIGKLLGRGGMGEVYAAEHLETGRRLALKVLRGRMADADDRARFLYEGRLAASVSHPHTVYIYGSEEIAGLSVITMELLPGGTLKDLVSSRGPLPPHEAVSAVLDLVGGLDAAQAAGILHRDIKPSNCFVDADGTVKVGDFGLSISTLARDVQASVLSGFQGTPQFAAPEQLQGRPLDVRADIYAVGGTLFYLLTGQTPFDARDLRELVNRVTTDPPRSPRALQPRVPAALASLVLQCLAKDPAGRPASYAALAEQLRPFATGTAQPARVGFRIIAGLIDSMVISVPFSVKAAMTADPVRQSSGGFSMNTSSALVTLSVGILYYVLLEGRWSASLGKRAMGLRVAGTSSAPTTAQIVRRTLMFYAPVAPVLLFTLLFGQQRLMDYFQAHLVQGLLFAISSMLLTASLFVTMRRSNGFSAVHDLVSGTRVVMRQRGDVRDRLAPRTVGSASTTPLTGVRCGPFDVVTDLGLSGVGRLLSGFDPTLRRPVWIHAVPAGTPAVTPERRDIGRPTRLHWLAGRRSDAENWDAYEAPPGLPFLETSQGSQPWTRVRSWLSDVAGELASCEREGATPQLSIDRLWLRDDGHVVLLDFSAPGVRPSTPANSSSATALLTALADHSIDASGPPLPLTVRSLLQSWRHSAGSAAAAQRDLVTLSSVPDRVDRWRRAIPIGLAATPVLLAAFGLAVAVPAFRAMTTPDRVEMITLLKIVEEAEKGGGSRFKSARELRAIEIYLAGTHRAAMQSPGAFGTGSVPSALGQLRPVAARVLERHPSVTAGELEEARGVVSGALNGLAEVGGALQPWILRGAAVMVVLLLTIAAAFASVCSLVSGAAVPGGALTRLVGLAAVDARGTEISRARSLARTALAWSPCVPWFLFLLVTPVKAHLDAAVPLYTAGAIVLTLMGAGAAWTIARPTRGPHDRLAGVWIVPR